MLTIFHYPKAKTFLSRRLSSQEKKTLAGLQASFFFSRKKLSYKNFRIRMMKNRQHQHEGKMVYF
jgi:hypothetical protein